MFCVFGVGFDTFFLLMISLIRMFFFILLRVMVVRWLNLVKLAVITFSIWMIWRMRNYACFQDKIEVYRVILVIKDLTCLVDNSSKALMKNDMSISMCSSFLVLTLVLVKFYVLFLLVESFLHHTGLKLTLMRLLGVIQVLPLVEVFFVEYGEVYWSFLCVS